MKYINLFSKDFILIFLFIMLVISIVLNLILFLKKDEKISVNLEDESKDIENEINNNMIEFTDTSVKEIMTPRTSIFAIDKETKISECIDEIINNGFSRIPIYDNRIDNIIGILYIKDILKANKNDKVSKYIRDVLYIPENKTISKLLEEFKIKQKHMAIIIDEYGGTSGLISIEDILEEIVGEIRDEYDIEVDKIIKISDNIYEIQGETLVEEVNEEIKSIMIEISDEYDTISGYVQYISGKVPEINEQITTNDFVIKILELENKRIKKIKLILLNLGGNKDE